MGGPLHCRVGPDRRRKRLHLPSLLSLSQDRHGIQSAVAHHPRRRQRRRERRHSSRHRLQQIAPLGRAFGRCMCLLYGLWRSLARC